MTTEVGHAKERRRDRKRDRVVLPLYLVVSRSEPHLPPEHDHALPRACRDYIELANQREIHGSRDVSALWLVRMWDVV